MHNRSLPGTQRQCRCTSSFAPCILHPASLFSFHVIYRLPRLLLTFCCRHRTTICHPFRSKRLSTYAIATRRANCFGHGGIQSSSNNDPPISRSCISKDLSYFSGVYLHFPEWKELLPPSCYLRRSPTSGCVASPLSSSRLNTQHIKVEHRYDCSEYSLAEPSSAINCGHAGRLLSFSSFLAFSPPKRECLF